MEYSQQLKAIICGVAYVDDYTFNYEMKELRKLAEACLIDVVDTFTQNLPYPNNTTYFGSGKILELANMAKAYEVDLVIFNDELSPAVLNNIANIMECEIMDRTNLILEIFKRRAQTKEANLQVELANLHYMLPRLIGRRTNLSRIGGGGGGGAGARRGAGETKLELDRRHIENRIYKLHQELESVVKDRFTARKLRMKQNTKVVAFVGYTNAGKSSTINSIMHLTNNEDSETKDVFVKDMLFATLETSTRRVHLENNHEFLITDTVGFVNKLPHHLVESFKSTLEEIKEASLIVHIIDSTSPYMDQHIKITNDVLKSIGVKDIPFVYAYNKIDKLTNDIFISSEFEPLIKISNKQPQTIMDLISYIDKTIFNDEITTNLLIPYTNGDVVNTLMQKANVLDSEYLDNGTKLNVTLSKHLYELYKQFEIK